MSHEDLQHGDRVRAVRFGLDEGLRIWPVDPSRNDWRLVRVDGQDDDNITELERGGSGELQHKHPDARFGINDNETVPPGTEGTVERVIPSSRQVWVKWDNGSRLGLAPSDVVEKLP